MEQARERERERERKKEERKKDREKKDREKKDRKKKNRMREQGLYYKSQFMCKIVEDATSLDSLIVSVLFITPPGIF